MGWKLGWKKVGNLIRNWVRNQVQNWVGNQSNLANLSKQICLMKKGFNLVTMLVNIAQNLICFLLAEDRENGCDAQQMDKFVKISPIQPSLVSVNIKLS